MIFAAAKNRFGFIKDIHLSDSEIVLILRETAEADAERGYLPTYYFNILSADLGTILGRCDLRIGNNKDTRYAGNIGYAVYEPYRGHRYALKACKLLLELAGKHSMKKLIITCNPDNIASGRTCELLGAEYIETIDVPETHELFKMGEKRKRVYEIKL